MDATRVEKLKTQSQYQVFSADLLTPRTPTPIRDPETPVSSNIHFEPVAIYPLSDRATFELSGSSGQPYPDQEESSAPC